MMAGDEKVVDGAPEDATDAGPDDGHPPPMMPGPEHLAPPSGHGGEEPRTEVARGVDRVARVEAERHSHEDDQEADEDGGDGDIGGRVAPVTDGEDHQDEQRGSHHLVDDAA